MHSKFASSVTAVVRNLIATAMKASHHDLMTIPIVRNIVQAVLVAVIYVLLARTGFYFAHYVSQVSPVWPPSGFAVGLLFLGGYHFWPGIYLGAFLANYLADEPVWTAALIASGNTFEAVAGMVIFSRLKFSASLSRVRDVLGFIGICAVLSPVIAASVGAIGLTLAEKTTWAQFEYVWMTWWVGDATGILVLSPMILLSGQTQWRKVRPNTVLEAVILVTLLVLVTLVVFTLEISYESAHLQYVVFPFMIWAALRFSALGSVTVTFTVTLISVWLTTLEMGPFVRFSPAENLLLLQIYLWALGTTGLILGAIVTERLKLNEQLLEARDAAVAASRSKSVFLANMSHELRTPLNAVIGYTEMLQEEVTGTAFERLSRDLAKIRSAAMHLLSLLSDVLDLSKVEAGKLEMVFQKFEVYPVAEEVLETLRPLAEKNANRLELECSQDFGEMVCDPMRLKQILLNLLGNAVKFTEQGSVTLRISTEQTGAGEQVIFSIIDTGIGMNAEQISELFQKFHQVDTSTTRRHGGTGLGLVISRFLAGLMGGTISVTSAQGEGSVFTLVLPRIHAA